MKHLLALVLSFGGLAVSTAAPLPVRAQEDVTLVEVDAVVREPLSQTFTVLGRLVARQRGVVAARVAGPVVEMLVHVGDRVAKGDALARIERDRLTWWRDVVAAELNEGTASLAYAEARLVVAEAGVGADEAGLTLARQEYARFDKLRQSAAFSQARLDDQRQTVLAAESDLDVARAEVQQAVSQIEQSRAKVQRATAILRIANDDVENSEIQAPFDGVVTVRHTEAGSYLEVGDDVITLINDGDLEIAADVPAVRLAGLSPGLVVSFQLDDGSPHEATVRAIGVEENSRTRTRPVRFSPVFGVLASDNGATQLADGQSAAVELPIGPPRDIVSVHKDAIIRDVVGSIVFVVADGVAERRLVELGEAVGSRFEVTSGLQPGELVVVRGNERLTPGQAVRFEESS